MSLKKTSVFLLLLVSIFYISCSNNEKSENRIIVGISSDVSTFNPLYAFNVNEGNITELLFLSLVKHSWNSEKGEIETTAMLAKELEWSSDSSSIIITIRDDVNWSDGAKCSIYDIIFSFDLYSDPDVQSKMFGSFKNFYTTEDYRIDLQKTFQIISENKLKINFKTNSAPDLFDIDLQILPKHILEKISRKEIANSDFNFYPVSNGPFKLRKWERNQVIILEKNNNSFLTKKETVDEIVFKIIPDYTSRINQLKTSEIDISEDITAEDIPDLLEYDHLKITPVKGRDYDYIGWNNIDQMIYNNENRFAPHLLFGNPEIRKALTHAINREEILETYLSNYGTLANGPVSPIFKSAIDTQVKNYEFNPELTKEILKKNGWKDNNHNGILEKGDKEFSFRLYIPAGNPRRVFAAEIIKNNFQSVGIEMNIEVVEMGMFIENLSSGKYDAWMAGWVIPIPIDLKQVWCSNPDEGHLNFAKYKNPEVDVLLIDLDKKKNPHEKNVLYKKIQSLIHNDEPYSFLYWIDNVVCHNTKINGLEINPLGVIHNCWEWKLKK